MTKRSVPFVVGNRAKPAVGLAVATSLFVGCGSGIVVGSGVDALDAGDSSESPDAASEQEPEPGAIVEERTLRVWHWNVAGNKVNEGRSDTGMPAAATKSLTDFNADFASFNELCENQFDNIKNQLIAKSWPTDPDNFARFVASRPASKTRCSGRYGNAIFSRRPLGTVDRVTLPDDTTVEKRALICGAVEDSVDVVFCSTHISVNGDVAPDGVRYNVRQLRGVLAHVEDYISAGQAVILAGDLNAQPNQARMKPFYSPSVDTPKNNGNKGLFREVDDDDPEHCHGYGEATGQRDTSGGCNRGLKIDYIFAEDARLRSHQGDSRPVPRTCVGGPCSDHHILTGTLELDLPITKSRTE